MTELYCLHRIDQLDAARAEFELVWAIVIRLQPELDTPAKHVRGWVEFLKLKNLLNPRTQIPPTK